MTFNDRDTEAPMTTRMVMLIGAIAGALSAVAVAMIARRRPTRRAEDGPTPFADGAELETFDSAGGGHFPPGSPPGGGHGGPRPGGGHGGGSAGGGHGRHPRGQGHG